MSEKRPQTVELDTAGGQAQHGSKSRKVKKVEAERTHEQSPQQTLDCGIGGEGPHAAENFGAGNEAAREKRRLCPHNRRKYDCKECGGAGICIHQRQRRDCKECGGSGICHHLRQRRFCKECHGSGICEHMRKRRDCKECQGSGICVHGNRKHYCRESGGAGVCEHGKTRSYCRLCRGLDPSSDKRQRRRHRALAHSTTVTTTTPNNASDVLQSIYLLEPAVGVPDPDLSLLVGRQSLAGS
mmetsp:Transcript_10955/g.21255  ORF Transcript_10955/g.21255 Transcript_10955/m.21255 type:complete len:241 (+) Transcript_10955:99-821(+)